MIVEYPVTEKSIQALKCFTWISSHIKVDLGGYDSREIVRLLENRHYDGIEKNLINIEKYGPHAGEIAERLVSCNDPMDFPRYLAELDLFIHFYEALGHCVQPVTTPRRGRSPDLQISLPDAKYLIEIYSPSDIFSFQLFERLQIQLIKFHKTKRGFDLKVNARSESLFYTQEFPPFREIHKWAKSFTEDFSTWIDTASVGDIKEYSSPIENYSFSIEVLRIDGNTLDRSIMGGGATHSTDTKLYFEIGEPEDFAKTNVGTNVREKLAKQQAGTQEPNLVRMLFVNLQLTNTTDLTWLIYDNYFSNAKNDILFLSADIVPYPPYDAVVFCSLDFECEFSPPIVLADKNIVIEDDLSQNLKISNPFSNPFRSDEEERKQVEAFFSWLQNDEQPNKR